ncbi:TIGR02217 family protein [Mesorhizobium australicum]|uniref:phage distal tail protein, Rcc01695 family n=1 Tax=Mesorhizobium australicum TaxID=536018 RepID=UPI0033354F0F
MDEFRTETRVLGAFDDGKWLERLHNRHRTAAVRRSGRPPQQDRRHAQADALRNARQGRRDGSFPEFGTQHHDRPGPSSGGSPPASASAENGHRKPRGSGSGSGMTFYNVVLPGFPSQGSEVAPVSLVDIGRGPSGHEKRRSRRSRRLRRFNIGKNIRTVNDVYEILSLFEVTNGPEHTFAIQNLLDWKSCKPEETVAATDAVIGVGDGSNAGFQLKKQYKITLVDGSTVVAIDRDIYLPVEGTVLIAVGGVLQAETTDWILDYETGAITFLAGHEPADEAVVTAGFEFNEIVRFDTNDLSQIMEFFRVGSVPSIPLMEVIPYTDPVPDIPPDPDPPPTPYIGRSQGVFSNVGGSPNTYTWADAPIATGASDLVVVGLVRESPFGSSSISLDVGGTPATLWGPGAILLSSAADGYLEFYHCVPGTLATADITLEANAAAIGANLFVWVLQGASDTPVDEVSSAQASSISIVLNDVQTQWPGATFALGITSPTITAGFTESWTGSETVVEDADVTSITGNFRIVACHLATTTTSGTTTNDLTLSLPPLLIPQQPHVGGAISFSN